MRIDKLNDHVGKPINETVLMCSTLRFNPKLCDEYCLVFDAEGISNKSGDPLTYRLTFTKNELQFLLGCAAKVRS